MYQYVCMYVCGLSGQQASFWKGTRIHPWCFGLNCELRMCCFGTFALRPYISPFLETRLKRTISCATHCTLKAAWTHSQRCAYTQPQKSGWQSCGLSWRKKEGSWALTALQEAAAPCPPAPWGWPSTGPGMTAAEKANPERPHPSIQNHSSPPVGQQRSRLPGRTRCPSLGSSGCPCCSSGPARQGPGSQHTGGTQGLHPPSISQGARLGLQSQSRPQWRTPRPQVTYSPRPRALQTQQKTPGAQIPFRVWSVQKYHA